MLKRWAAVVAVLSVSAAVAGPISFTKIVDTEDGVFQHFAAPAYNDNGVVAFWGLEFGTGETAIYTTTLGGPLDTVADTGGPINNFGQGWVALNNSDQVAFWSVQDDASQAVHYGDKSGLTTVLDTHTTFPGQGTFTVLGPSVDVNDSGVVSIHGLFNTGLSGLYTWDSGSIDELVSWKDGFQGFHPYTSINNSGTAASWAKNNGDLEQILSLQGGGISVVAQQSSIDDIRRLGRYPVINDLGEIAYWAEGYSSSKIGIYKAGSSGIEKILETDNPLFQQYAFNNLGTVAYIDEVTQGLYYNGGASPTLILGPGDLVEGKQVQSVHIASESLNNLNELAVYAIFEDGTRGIYVAGLPPVPEPASLAVLLFGGVAIWRRRRHA